MHRAILSVSDKTGIAPFARGLVDLGFELVSTGGTLAALLQEGIPARAVSEVTGFPEILEGRVKTLHPSLYGGILARPTEEHRRELASLGMAAVDLVAVNLYPFRETVARPEATSAEALEKIDIGGPALIRAAAKNHAAVVVVVDPADYPGVLEALAVGLKPEQRRRLARKAFAHTAAYDAAIVRWFDREVCCPDSLHLTLERAVRLRYGENPHQGAERYRFEGQRGFWDAVIQHKGRDLSYLNLLDAEAAWRLAHEFALPAAVVVKHANPCGVAVAEGAPEAYRLAFEADPLSAFGGVVAINREVDAELAAMVMANPKADVLIAPGYTPEALETLAKKRKAMRVLEAPLPGRQELDLRLVDGGLLVQEPDTVPVQRDAWQVVTRAAPSEGLWRDLQLAWTVCAYAKSNAIVLAAGGQVVGIGAGQQSRVDAADIAVRKAAGRAAGGACASDAFFPFRDGLDRVAEAGVAGVIQPGGSVRDSEVVAAAEEHGIAMVHTGRRHFRH